MCLRYLAVLWWGPGAGAALSPVSAAKVLFLASTSLRLLPTFHFPSVISQDKSRGTLDRCERWRTHVMCFTSSQGTNSLVLPPQTPKARPRAVQLADVRKLRRCRGAIMRYQAAPEAPLAAARVPRRPWTDPRRRSPGRGKWGLITMRSACHSSHSGSRVFYAAS